MSFALSLDQGRLEWASHGLDSVFAQRGNLANPQFWTMLYHVVRFGRKAPEVPHIDSVTKPMRLAFHCLGLVAQKCFQVSKGDTWGVH